MLEVELTNKQTLPIDTSQLVQAARNVLRDAGVKTAEVSIAVVDNSEIQVLNRRFLNHDYATDTLSFLLESGEDWLQGEIIVSAEMAAQRAEEFGWLSANELLLYVIHAMLHLVGYDDHEEADRQQMRAAEAAQLAQFNVHPNRTPA